MPAVIDPADPRQLDDLLRRHRVELKHSFGQNFLTDPALRDTIARLSGAQPGADALEVGAGVGTLTIALAPLCRRLVAVELDRRLMPPLRECLAGHENVEIIESDILKLDLGALFADGGELVVGNIPYSLTGALLRKLLDVPPRPRRLSLVVQREVAERWTASSGASLATVAVQVFAQARIELIVPASAFTPSPRVDSALVVLEVRDRPAVEVDDMDAFFRMVEAAFQFRRKQLGNALGRIAAIGSSEAASRLRELGIEPRRRPQTLNLQEWEAVYKGFGSRRGR